MTIELSNTSDYLAIRNGLVALKNSDIVSDFELQKTIEKTYSKKNLRGLIRKDLEEDELFHASLFLCKRLIDKWIDEDHYDTKKESLKALKEFDVETMLLDFLTVLMQQDQNYFEMTKIVGQLVSYTPYDDDYMVGVKRCCEILVKMAEADLINIDPAYNSPLGQVSVQVPFDFEGETGEAIARAKFLPPMVCKPKKVTKNSQSGYLTQQSHRITKRLQRHNGDICLDTINLSNQIAYSINMEVLERVSDEFSVDEEKDMDEATQRMLWENHQERTYKTALEMIALGNKFYFEWFKDYRGREYDRGYELHLQGKSFKKAMLDFHEHREVDGWEAYANDFDFTLPEEYLNDIDETTEVQEEELCTMEIPEPTPEPSTSEEDDLPWETDTIKYADIFPKETVEEPKPTDIFVPMF